MFTELLLIIIELLNQGNCGDDDNIKANIGDNIVTNIGDNIETMSGGSIAASSVSNENDSLSFEEYKNYCSQHPGPLSERSFKKWKDHGGMDEPSFKWRAHPYRGVGRHQRKNSNQKVFSQ
ncbi:uncharacterized protein LOC136076097 isoform X2 [Hydra vulgaris]|uniref:uncharacterized protein LOC136076097 isoform X2 n=1 Tax=Hydra vulgaris TaxID=6087 RepID=UPI0032EA6CC2